MIWNAWTLWWVAAGLLVGAELLSGSFYLLMLALGLAAAGLAAGLGASLALQLLAAALVGGGAVAAWHAHRLRTHSDATAANRDVHLDLGQQVMVQAWDQHGQTTVQYRGARWQAIHRGPLPPRAGLHAIVAVESIHLVLSPVSS